MGTTCFGGTVYSVFQNKITDSPSFTNYFLYSIYNRFYYYDSNNSAKLGKRWIFDSHNVYGLYNGYMWYCLGDLGNNKV